MRLHTKHKVISLILISVLLSHLTFLHAVLENYVVCNGSHNHSGTTEIHSADYCESHSSGAGQTISGSITLHNNHCDDSALHQKCFEDEQFITKTNVFANPTLIVKTIIALPELQQIISDKQLNIDRFINCILSNYSTVSLII